MLAAPSPASVNESPRPLPRRGFLLGAAGTLALLALPVRASAAPAPRTAATTADPYLYPELTLFPEG